MPIITEVTYDEPSRSFLVKAERNGELRGVAIPIQAVASWSERLGYTDAVDTIDAICHFRWEETEPKTDPITGENYLSEEFVVQKHIEGVREAEAMKAVEEGTADDPRSPRLRSALALNKVCSKDKEILNMAKKKVRQKLRVPEPSQESPVLSRIESMTCETSACTLDTKGCEREFCSEDREKIAQAVHPHMDEIIRGRRGFLHAHTDFEKDPLETKRSSRDLSLEAVRRRYSKDSRNAA